MDIPCFYRAIVGYKSSPFWPLLSQFTSDPVFAPCFSNFRISIRPTSHLLLLLPSNLFPCCFQTKIVYACLLTAMLVSVEAAEWFMFPNSSSGSPGFECGPDGRPTFFRDISQSLLENSRTVPEITPCPFFPYHFNFINYEFTYLSKQPR
jgi:hypothetical protein